MKTFLMIIVLTALLAPCLGAAASTRFDIRSSRSTGELQPDFSRSFATIKDTSTGIVLLGDDWALQVNLPNHDSVLECGSYAVDGTMSRGPNPEQFIRPSSGPANHPLPTGKTYAIKGLVVAVHDTIGAYGGALVLQFSGFEAGGSRFPSLGPFKLAVKAPSP